MADATTAKLRIDSTPRLEVEGYPPQEVPRSSAEESYSHSCTSCEGCPAFNKLFGAGLRIGLGNRVRSKNASIQNGRTHCSIEISLQLKFASLVFDANVYASPLKGCAAKRTDFGSIWGVLSHLLWDVEYEYSKANSQCDRHHTRKSTMVTYSVG